MNSIFTECREEYQRALKAANKEQRQRVNCGTNPYRTIK